MSHTTLAETEELRNRAKVLLEEFTFQFARLCVNTGTKNPHPIYSPYRYQLGSKLKYGSDRTITRILGELSAKGWIYRLPQRKDLKRGKFGPLRLAPSRKLWVRLRRMIRTLKAEDARKLGKSNSLFPSHSRTHKPPAKKVQHLLTLERVEGNGRGREKDEGTIFKFLKPDMSLTEMVEAIQKAKTKKVGENV